MLSHRVPHRVKTARARSTLVACHTRGMRSDPGRGDFMVEPFSQSDRCEVEHDQAALMGVLSSILSPNSFRGILRREAA